MNKDARWIANVNDPDFQINGRWTLDVEAGQELTLQGKSLKGKNRVRELGSLWVVLRVAEKVGFSTTGTGPFLLIQPVQ